MEDPSETDNFLQLQLRAGNLAGAEDGPPLDGRVVKPGPFEVERRRLEERYNELLAEFGRLKQKDINDRKFEEQFLRERLGTWDGQPRNGIDAWRASREAFEKHILGENIKDWKPSGIREGLTPSFVIHDEVEKFVGRYTDSHGRPNGIENIPLYSDSGVERPQARRDPED